MATEKREPREWWLLIEDDDLDDIRACRTPEYAEEEHVRWGVARTHVVYVREVLEDGDGKETADSQAG